jgi:hypothetical protein
MFFFPDFNNESMRRMAPMMIISLQSGAWHPSIYKESMRRVAPMMHDAWGTHAWHPSIGTHPEIPLAAEGDLSGIILADVNLSAPWSP